jgi:hypothetical protein
VAGPPRLAESRDAIGCGRAIEEVIYEIERVTGIAGSAAPGSRLAKPAGRL